MSDYPTLVTAQKIVKEFMDDGFQCFIIYGKQRLGKSGFAIKVADQVLKHLFNKQLTKENLHHYMGWNPYEVIDEWTSVKKKQPFYIWDDAGYWLHNTDWADPFLVAISKYMNLVGTDYGTLILTTPDPQWILSKISNLESVKRIKIIKRSGGKGDSDTVKFSRRAVCYEPYRSPDLKKTGVNKRWEDDYNCKIRQDIYDYYKPLRESYNTLAKETIREEIFNKAKVKEIKELRYEANKQKLENMIAKEKAKKLKLIQNNIDLLVAENG